MLQQLLVNIIYVLLYKLIILKVTKLFGMQYLVKNNSEVAPAIAATNTKVTPGQN